MPAMRQRYLAQPGRALRAIAELLWTIGELYAALARWVPPHVANTERLFDLAATARAAGDLLRREVGFTIGGR